LQYCKQLSARCRKKVEIPSAMPSVARLARLPDALIASREFHFERCSGRKPQAQTQRIHEFSIEHHLFANLSPQLRASASGQLQIPTQHLE
jgi:hypothetical protein